MLHAQGIVEEGLISSAQLECIIYANMRFTTDLSAEGDPPRACLLSRVAMVSRMCGAVHLQLCSVLRGTADQ